MKTSIFQNSNENIERSPEKLPESYKKIQGRNPYNIFVANLENRCLRKFILSLNDF